MTHDKELSSEGRETDSMSGKTIAELTTNLRGEIKWFRSEARRYALNANQTAVASARIAALIQQEVHLQIGDKLAEWADRFEKADGQ